MTMIEITCSSSAHTQKINVESDQIRHVLSLHLEVKMGARRSITFLKIILFHHARVKDKIMNI
jgi:hypothetical protein